MLRCIRRFLRSHCFYDRIAAVCRAGLTIEIGGGIGNLKRRLTELVATDIHLIGSTA
jgi:hypothetical protein